MQILNRHDIQTLFIPAKERVGFFLNKHFQTKNLFVFIMLSKDEI